MELLFIENALQFNCLNSVGKIISKDKNFTTPDNIILIRMFLICMHNMLIISLLQYFVFDFHMAPVMLFDKIITLTVSMSYI